MIHPLHAPEARPQLAGEDLLPGTVVAQRNVLLDKSAFTAFAALTGDAHPIHYEEAHARSKGLRAPIAHGLLITAVTALGATDLSAQLSDSMIAMLGVEVKFVSPVFVGDTVTVRMAVGDVARKSGNRCIATFDVEVLSAQGEVHARLKQHYMLKTTLAEAS
jgi:3-hydroxybutyryl-CoA dehydratase